MNNDMIYTITPDNALITSVKFPTDAACTTVNHKPRELIWEPVPTDFIIKDACINSPSIIDILNSVPLKQKVEWEEKDFQDAIKEKENFNDIIQVIDYFSKQVKEDPKMAEAWKKLKKFYDIDD